MFSGVYQHGVDAKGRTSLPSAFRDVLSGKNSDKIFITVDLYGECLQAYAPDEWKAFVSKVDALPQFDDATRMIVRAMIMPSHECPFDKLGRIILPPQLREAAGLSDQVVWAGGGKRIELWTPELWQKKREEIRTPQAQAALKAKFREMQL